MKLHSVIAQLRLALEAFHESNERKSQTALLIASYKIIGDAVFSNRYKNLSINYFNRTAYLHQQNALADFLSRDTWYAARNMGMATPMFFENHLENEYGIRWTGPDAESLASRFLSLFRERSYNELFKMEWNQQNDNIGRLLTIYKTILYNRQI